MFFFPTLFVNVHLRNCRQLLNTVTLVLTWRTTRFLTLTIFYLDNSGKVWLIRTRRIKITQNSLLLLETIVAAGRVRAANRCNCLSRNVSDNKNAFRSAVVFGRLLDLAEQTCEEYCLLASRSYKHLQHQVTGLASVLLNLQSSNAYGRVVSDPVEGAPYVERPLLVLRNAAGA